MTVRQFYDSISGDYEDAVGRLLNEELIRRFALKFADDPSYDTLCACLTVGQTDEAFRAAHTLKGVCRNLSFTKLAESVSDLTDLLRMGQTEEARSTFEQVKSDYERVLNQLCALELCG